MLRPTEYPFAIDWPLVGLYDSLFSGSLNRDQTDRVYVRKCYDEADLPERYRGWLMGVVKKRIHEQRFDQRTRLRRAKGPMTEKETSEYGIRACSLRCHEQEVLRRVLRGCVDQKGRVTADPRCDHYGRFLR